MNPVSLSIITHNVDARTVVASTVSELISIITTHTWSPSIFNNNRRTVDNFQSTSILGLDVDGGSTMAEAAAKLNGFKYIIAPTRSHLVLKNGIICERFRIVLFLNNIITDSATYAATWNTAFQMLPFIDPAAKDTARQFFKSTSVELVSDGEFFPISTSNEKVRKIQKIPTMQFPVPKFVTDFMQNGSDQWNATLFKAAKLLQESGYEFDDALDLLSNMSNSQYKGALDSSDIKTIKSAFSKVGKYDPQIPWPVTIPTRHGTEVVDSNNHENFIYFFEEVMKFKLQYNELRNCIEFNGKQLDDMDLSKFRLRCREFYLKPNTELIIDVINEIAVKNTYHPLKQVIEETPWDGHDYITDLFNTIQIDGDILPIYKEYLRRWVCGLVTKLYNPGSQTNVLVFLGPQAAGKSLWLEKFGIVPDIFTESLINPESKDDLIRTTKTVIWSISELDAVTRKKDASLIKGFLTNGTFDVRSPYDRYSKQLKSVCSFAASVNERQFLVDPTGNRRFCIIPVVKLDKSHNINMQQVYAQGFAMMKSGEPFYFSREEILEINTINEEYLPNNRMDYLTCKIIKGTDQITADELLTLIGYKESRHGGDFSSLGRSLKSMGIVGSRATVNGQKLTVYNINKIETTKNCGGL